MASAFQRDDVAGLVASASLWHGGIHASSGRPALRRGVQKRGQVSGGTAGGGTDGRKE